MEHTRTGKVGKALPQIPASLRQLMAELGPKWATDISGHSRMQSAAFSEILRDAPKEGNVTRDIAYGSHPRQVLDVFAPPGAQGAPVVIFAHGGAFVIGQKDRTPEIYSNVCWYFVRHGMVAVNLEYRLAPEFKYPSGVEDVASALAWVRAHIGDFGGDTERVYLMGHSAGGAHVGCYAFDKRFHPKGRSGISGLILVSSRVRIDDLPENPNADKVRAYFPDAAAMEQGSVVSHVARGVVPTMIAIAEYENPLLDSYGLELAHRLSLAERRAPRVVWLAGHNHNSSIAHLNTADERLGREMLDFIRLGH